MCKIIQVGGSDLEASPRRLPLPVTAASKSTHPPASKKRKVRKSLKWETAIERREKFLEKDHYDTSRRHVWWMWQFNTSSVWDKTWNTWHFKLLLYCFVHMELEILNKDSKWAARFNCNVKASGGKKYEIANSQEIGKFFKRETFKKYRKVLRKL